MADLATIAEASRLAAEAELLLEKSDALLAPLYHAAVAKGDRAEIQSLIHLFPRGFYRTELQVVLNNLG